MAWSEKTKKIYLSLMKDIQTYCSEQHLNHLKELAVLEIFSASFKYFVNSRIATNKDLIEFFQEQTLRYAVDVKSGYTQNSHSISNAVSFFTASTKKSSIVNY